MINRRQDNMSPINQKRQRISDQASSQPAHEINSNDNTNDAIKSSNQIQMGITVSL